VILPPSVKTEKRVRQSGFPTWRDASKQTTWPFPSTPRAASFSAVQYMGPSGIIKPKVAVKV
ncbi:MAG: hypothetical protein WDK95_15080, partial [Syntrophorhabdaceae bacterium]